MGWLLAFLVYLLLAARVGRAALSLGRSRDGWQVGACLGAPVAAGATAGAVMGSDSWLVAVILAIFGAPIGAVLLLHMLGPAPRTACAIGDFAPAGPPRGEPMIGFARCRPPRGQGHDGPCDVIVEFSAGDSVPDRKPCPHCDTLAEWRAFRCAGCGHPFEIHRDAAALARAGATVRTVRIERHPRSLSDAA